MLIPVLRQAFSLHATLMRPYYFILLLLLASCKVTEKNVYGHFEMKDGINTSLDFDSSGHFTYIQCNPLIASVKEKRYVLTKGVWTFQNREFITLNSLPRNDDY